MAHQSVADVMTRDIVTVSSTTPVVEAARRMRDHHIGDVLVVDEGSLRGVVTDRDLTLRVVAEGRDPASTLAGEVISADPLTTESTVDASEAVRLMRDHAVRRLPVVEDDRVVGVVSLGDLAVERDPSSALGDISAAPPRE